MGRIRLANSSMTQRLQYACASSASCYLAWLALGFCWNSKRHPCSKRCMGRIKVVKSATWLAAPRMDGFVRPLKTWSPSHISPSISPLRSSGRLRRVRAFPLLSFSWGGGGGGVPREDFTTQSVVFGREGQMEHRGCDKMGIHNHLAKPSATTTEHFPSSCVLLEMDSMPLGEWHRREDLPGGLQRLPRPWGC